jgi:hypothetical protein
MLKGSRECHKKIKESLVMSANKNRCLSQHIVLTIKNKEFILRIPGTRGIFIFDPTYA